MSPDIYDNNDRIMTRTSDPFSSTWYSIIYLLKVTTLFTLLSYLFP